MCAHGSGLVSPLAWTNLFVTVCAQRVFPFRLPRRLVLSVCKSQVLTGLFTVVRLSLPTPGSGVSGGGSTTLSQVVVQPATSVLRSHVVLCGAPLGDLAHCLSTFAWSLRCFGLVIPGSSIPGVL